MSEEVKVPLIEMDQIAPGSSPEYYLAAVYIDGEMRDKRHSLELHIDTDCDEIIRMMAYFYSLGFEEGGKTDSD